MELTKHITIRIHGHHCDNECPQLDRGICQLFQKSLGRSRTEGTYKRCDGCETVFGMEYDYLKEKLKDFTNETIWQEDTTKQ